MLAYASGDETANLHNADKFSAAVHYF